MYVLQNVFLILHRVQAELPPPTQQILEKLQSSDPVLVTKKVLIIDDDVRNIFALTSMLERYQMQVLYAENGRDGIELLQKTPDIDIVLMDVMMPGMDGYETTRMIRQDSKFKSLPIVALTAKAMQGDREKCIEAGASDYITKPVDTEQLLSLLRVWLYR
jgi:CheY-like chemotaxis protein